MNAYSKKQNRCAICETKIKKELEYGYCMSCAKDFLLPFSMKTTEPMDYEGLRKSVLVDKNYFTLVTIMNIGLLQRRIGIKRYQLAVLKQLLT